MSIDISGHITIATSAKDIGAALGNFTDSELREFLDDLKIHIGKNSDYLDCDEVAGIFADIGSAR